MNKYLLSIMKGEQSSFVAQLITYLLLPWSLIYGLGVFCHRNYYRLRGAYKAPKPVISIGNITVGGSGKTPLVVWLARSLEENGFKSIILTRGYMPKRSKISDEVEMLKEQIPLIPVMAGGNRVRNIRKSINNIVPGDLFICDDAFQHWPLRRDLNIVAIDAVNPFGNGYLLPAGILREPLSSLKRANVLVLTKTDGSSDLQTLSSKLKRINPKALIVESRYKSVGVVDAFEETRLPEDFLKEKSVVGFCGIGQPISFESSLRKSGAKVIKLFTYRDHYIYKKNDIRRMVEFCRAQSPQAFVTTHKDAVKLRALKDQFAGIPLVYIPIQLEITKGSDEFIQKIISICLH
jgi:tetraacyldisaccharide 4'-kinase